MDEAKKQKKWIIRISTQSLVSVLPGLFYLANLVRMLGVTATPYFVVLYGAGVLGILVALFSRKYKLNNLIVFFLFYIFTLVINWLTIGNISFTDIGENVLLIGITFIILTYRWTYRNGLFVFLTTAAIIVYALNTRSILRIFNSSNNYISVILLLSVSFFYISIDLNERKLRLADVFPAAICFLISVWAGGRGGILSTAILLTLILILYMQKLTNKRAKRSIIIGIILIAVGVILVLQDVDVFDSFMSLGKLATRGIDNDDRILIWGSYFSKVQESFGYFLAGAPLRNIPIIYQKAENCHNSFIQLHAYNGIFMFIVFFVTMIRSGSYYWKNKQFVTLAMLAAIVIRGMTDKFIFGQYGMPIMLFFALYPHIARQRN